MKKNLCVMQVLPAMVSGGVERGTMDIAQALIDKGHQAIVVSSGGPLVKQLDKMGATHMLLPVHSKNPWQMWRNAQALKKLIRENKVSIVHARSRAPAWSCYWATNDTHTPFITTFHGAHGHSNRLKRWYNSIMLRGIKTIAVSHFIAKHIQQVYPHYQPDIHVIHRGIDTQKFNPDTVSAEKLQQLKQQWTIPADKIVIMLPGRITRLKGHAILIDAISRLNHPNLICMFVGDNHGNQRYQQQLETQITQLNLEKTIRFAGGCEDMACAYRLANIVVSASTKPESFGRVSCEAQAMGCLVVATHHGGTQETVSDSQKPFLCVPNDADSLYNALERALATSDSERQMIAEQSQNHIATNFSLEKMCKETLDVYHQAIEKS